MATRSTDTWLRLLFRMMDGINGATIGLLAYGGWAYYANSAHGEWIAIRSGIAQGSMSFIVTLTSVLLMRGIFARVQGSRVARAAAAALGSLAVIYTGIVGVHLYLGTPEIFLTMLPGIPITIGFCVVFCAGLARLEGQDEQNIAAAAAVSS